MVSSDEKTSTQARARRHPSLAPAPGRDMRVEFEYERGGALQYLATWDVHRAKILGRCEEKTGIVPFGRLVSQVMTTEPYKSARRVFWVVDNGSSHRGQAACRRLSDAWPNAALVQLSVHASWLNQVEIFFSIVQCKVLTPNDLEDLAEVADRLVAFERRYEQAAAPFEWMFTRDDLALLAEALAYDQQREPGRRSPSLSGSGSSLGSMYGSQILVRSLSRPGVTDRYGNVWQYHPRSDRHSKIACWAIAFDLLAKSALLRRHVTEGRVVLGINHRMVDFATGRSKNLDLVFARPEAAAGRRTLRSMGADYGIVLDKEEQSVLEELPEWYTAPAGAVLVALEAKAAMTAFIRALPRLYDELNSSHLCTHGASSQALAVGFAMVNGSSEFVSPDRNRRVVGPGAAATVSTEPQPRSLARTLGKLEEIPRRSNVRDTGFDALGIVVVEGRNDGSPFNLVTRSPAPQPGSAYHYDSMVLRVANEYDTTFSTI